MIQDKLLHRLSQPTFLERAGAWFLDSGIQESTGGVARFYRVDLRENRPISTEITGYGISMLLFLHSQTGDRDYLESALRAGRFLTRIAWDPVSCAFPFEYGVRDPETKPLAYFFDCGIIARGLLQLWRSTEDEEFLNAAIECGRGMLTDFPSHDAGVEPILGLPEKTPLPRGESWSRQPGCYQLKSALAWLELHATTGENVFLAAYNRMVGAALAHHKRFLPGTDQALTMDRLHAYCYFLEGLLPRASEPRCADAIRTGIDDVSEHLRETEHLFARSDVYAQLLRLRLFAEGLGVQPVDRLFAEQEAQTLDRFQIESSDWKTRGGFYFGRRNGKMIPHVNPVSTGFAIQALTLWKRYRSGETPSSVQTVI